jgi:hypothetical protein
MEVGGRDKIMPSHISRKALNPSLKRIVKCQRLERLTQRVMKVDYLGLHHSPRSEKGRTRIWRMTDESSGKG